MRWQNPKHGDVRIKKKFALLPIEINGENRWLEWVKIKYIYHNGTIFREKKAMVFIIIMVGEQKNLLMNSQHKIAVLGGIYI